MAVAAGVMLPLYVFLFARAGLHPRRLLGRIWLPVVIAASVGLSALGISEVLPVEPARLHPRRRSSRWSRSPG